MAKLLNVESEQRQILERILNSHERVNERLLRTTKLLEASGVQYAIVGGNAVAVWVATRDESLVRTTRDIDLLIDRTDFDCVRAALESGGFVFCHVSSIDMFLDGPDAKAGEAIHVVYSGEKVLPEHPTSASNASSSVAGPEFRVATLDSLVRMKLTAWRDKDRVHLRDLIFAGLLDSKWLERLDATLSERLKFLLDHPE